MMIVEVTYRPVQALSEGPATPLSWETDYGMGAARECRGCRREVVAINGMDHAALEHDKRWDEKTEYDVMRCSPEHYLVPSFGASWGRRGTFSVMVSGCHIVRYLFA